MKGDLHTPTLQIDKAWSSRAAPFMEAAAGGLKPPATAAKRRADARQVAI